MVGLIRARWAEALVLLPLLAAVALPAAVVREPVLTGLGLAALVAGTGMLLRLDWAVLVFVAVAPFEDYLATVSGSSVKLVGLAVFAAWGLRLLVDRGRGRLRHPAVTAALGLALVVLAALLWHDNGPDGVTVTQRYLSFIGAFVVLVDVMRRLVSPVRVAAIFAASCAVAAVLGLYESVALGEYRAAGPIGDANDFAFFLVAAFPLALALRAGGHRRFWTACAVAHLAGIAGSLSRGAVLGLVVMATWAFFRGHLRARTALGSLTVVTLALGAVVFTVPDLVSEKIAAKEKVATTNVDERKLRWTAAAEMTADSPLLGLGPGGFLANFQRYAGEEDDNPTHALRVAHMMYLEISAELGLLGLLAFLLVLGWGARGAARAGARLPRGPDLAVAVAVRASLVGMAVAAVFLTEQYFLPVWLVPAMGAALDLRAGRG